MKVKKLVLFVFLSTCFIFFVLFLFRKTQVSNEISVLRSRHFKISYSGILKTEALSISKSLEDNYTKIRTELQDPEHQTIAVFVHGSQKDFNMATGLHNSQASGTSRGPNEFHLMYQTWLNSLFPSNMDKVAVHEFAHCVQINILIEEAKKRYGNLEMKDFNTKFEKEFAQNYPQWFWEALSDYEAGMVNTLSVKYAIRKRPSLDFLNKSGQIYNLGYTIIDYMASTYGKDKIPEFIKSYGNFEITLGVNQKQFEKDWHNFVEKNY